MRYSKMLMSSLSGSAFLLLLSPSFVFGDGACPNQDGCQKWIDTLANYGLDRSSTSRFPHQINYEDDRGVRRNKQAQLAFTKEIVQQGEACKCSLELINEGALLDNAKIKLKSLEEYQAAIDVAEAKRKQQDDEVKAQFAIKLAEKAKAKEEAQKNQEAIAKQSQTPSCKKSYSFMHYCKNLGMLKAQQNQLNRERGLASRSGYTDKAEVRRYTAGIMEMEKAVANAKSFYNKFSGSAPPLSACKVVKDEGNNFVPDANTQKTIDGSLQKNCGTTEPDMDF